MKNKSSKRSLFSKNTRNSLNPSKQNVHRTKISSNYVDLGVGTALLDSHAPCLKANLPLKSQKVLKRDLLRCSDQRPSLLGTQTLQPPRIYHGSHQTNTTHFPSAWSSVDHQQAILHRQAVSMNPRAFHATIDRIGPWPDVSINRLPSDGNDLLRPLKNFRNARNPRVFSPKYYAGLTENTSKFNIYSSTRSYIEEYRKQKGYVLDGQKLSSTSSLPWSTSLTNQTSDDDLGSSMRAGNSSVNADYYHSITKRDRMLLSSIESSTPSYEYARPITELLEHGNTPPSIPSVSKSYGDTNHANYFPTLNMRNGHPRTVRRPPHHSNVAQQSQSQQAIALPFLTGSSLHYMTSMNSIEKAYSSTKKPATQNQSKLYFVDTRQRKRIPQRLRGSTELLAHSQDHFEMQATGAPEGTVIPPSTAVVVYQLSQRPLPMIYNQNEAASFSYS